MIGGLQLGQDAIQELKFTRHTIKIRTCKKKEALISIN